MLSPTAGISPMRLPNSSELCLRTLLPPLLNLSSAVLLPQMKNQLLLQHIDLNYAR